MNANDAEVRVEFEEPKGTPRVQSTSLENAAALLEGWGLYETTAQARDAILTGVPIVTRQGTRFVLESR